MSKIKIKTKITKEKDIKKYETYGILKENMIIYYENRDKIKIKQEDDIITIFKENEDVQMEFIFKKEDSKLKIKLKEGNFVIPILLNQINYNENKIVLDYKVEENIKFELVWEECL